MGVDRYYCSDEWPFNTPCARPSALLHVSCARTSFSYLQLVCSWTSGSWIPRHGNTHSFSLWGHRVSAFWWNVFSVIRLPMSHIHGIMSSFTRPFIHLLSRSLSHSLSLSLMQQFVHSFFSSFYLSFTNSFLPSLSISFIRFMCMYMCMYIYIHTHIYIYLCISYLYLGSQKNPEFTDSSYV